jgi:hypothetical protein
MPKKRKQPNETIEEQKIRMDLEAISNYATRSEKMSFHRMMDNLVKAIAELKPIQDKILELETKKIPLVDEIATLRNKMVRDCVHPYEHLVHKGDHIECKFCNKKFALTKWQKED